MVEALSVESRMFAALCFVGGLQHWQIRVEIDKARASFKRS